MAKSGWQPIETAPKATSVWLFDPEVGQHSGFFYDGMWVTVVDEDLWTVNPTHWMPLPEPPEAL